MSARLPKARCEKLANDITSIYEASRSADSTRPGQPCYPHIVGGLSVVFETLAFELWGIDGSELIRRAFEAQRLKEARLCAPKAAN